jgi:hypothetical protein
LAATIYAAPPEGEALIAAHGGGEEWLTDELPTFSCATHEILDGATHGLGRKRAPVKNSLHRLSSSVTRSATAASLARARGHHRLLFIAHPGFLVGAFVQTKSKE